MQIKKNIEDKELIECTVKRLKDEIDHRKVLILNNSSLLRVVYNKITALNVLVTFNPSNIPYLYLNEYNFGMLTFESKTEYKYIDNQIDYDQKTKSKDTKESCVPNLSQIEYFNLK